MSSTPGHLTFVALVALVLYGVVMVDYLGIQYEWPFWMALYSEVDLRWMDGLPDWIDGTYGVAAVAGVLGAILLWAGFGGAPLVLFVAAAALLVEFVYVFAFDYPGLRAIFGWTGVWVALIVALVAFAIYLYARQMHRREVI